MKVKFPRVPKGVSTRVRALLACGILLGTGAIGTTALWSTTSATTSGGFTTATIDIRANGEISHTFTFSEPVYPGFTTQNYVINVSNPGTTSIRYSIRASSSNPLVQGMDFFATSNSTCSPGAFNVNVLANDIRLNAGGTTIGTNRGPLAAGGGSQPICVRLTLPGPILGFGGAPQSLAGQTGSVTLTFDTPSIP